MVQKAKTSSSMFNVEHVADCTTKNNYPIRSKRETVEFSITIMADMAAVVVVKVMEIAVE